MCDGGMCATVFREIGFPGQAREHKCLNNLLLLSFHGQLWIAKNRQIEVMAVGEIGKSYPGKALRDSMVVIQAQGHHPQTPRCTGTTQKARYSTWPHTLLQHLQQK